MHLKEGASGVPSRVGMVKTGRCEGGGAEGGCGCPGGSNVRAEATGWKARQAQMEKRSCASPSCRNRGAFTCSGVGGRFAPLAVSPAPVPPPPAQPTLMLQPAPHPHWLNWTATHREAKTQNSVKGGTWESFPSPATAG